MPGGLFHALPLLGDIAVIALADDEYFDGVIIDRINNAVFACIHPTLSVFRTLSGALS